MIRLRGGLHTMERVRRVKIARADIVRGVDNMEAPLLERLVKDPQASGPNSSTASAHLRNIIAELSRAGTSTGLIKILWSLDTVCQNLEIAWTGSSDLDARTYYETMLCLNHDLLSLDSRCSLDEVLRISLLDFTQPMFRYCAFGQRSCRLRSARLRSLIEQLDATSLDDDLLLWIMFNGCMTSYRTNQRPWYRTRLVAILGESGISSGAAWEQIKARMQRFLWTDSIHDPIGKGLYNSLKQGDNVFTFQIPCRSCGGCLYDCGLTRSPPRPPNHVSTSSPKNSLHCQMNP